MAFVSRIFHKGSRSEVANSYQEETALLWDGWTPDGAAPVDISGQRVTRGELGALVAADPAVRAAYAQKAGGNTLTGKQVVQADADERALDVLSSGGARVVKVTADSAQDFSTVSLYPPGSENRVRLELWSKPDGVAGNRRPLSVEAHGMADMTSQNPGADNHVTIYSIGTSGESKKVMEWTWGEQWDGYLKVSDHLRVFGTFEVSGGNGIRLYNNRPLSIADSTGAFRAVVNLSATNNLTLGDGADALAAVILKSAAAQSVRLRVGATDVVTVAANTVTLADAKDLAVGTTTGTKIGTAATQKLGFFGKAPVAQQAAVASPAADAAALKTAVDGLRTALASLGLIAP